MGKNKCSPNENTTLDCNKIKMINAPIISLKFCEFSWNQHPTWSKDDSILTQRSRILLHCDGQEVVTDWIHPKSAFSSMYPKLEEKWVFKKRPNLNKVFNHAPLSNMPKIWRKWKTYLGVLDLKKHFSKIETKETYLTHR